jgi:hypothetical protein
VGGQGGVDFSTEAIYARLYLPMTMRLYMTIHAYIWYRVKNLMFLGC